MKPIFLAVILSLTAAAPLFADDGTNVLGDDKSRLSYAIGMMLGQNFFKQNNLDTDMVDVEITAQAIKAVQTGGPTLLTTEEMQQTLKAFQAELASKQQAIHEQEAVKNKEAGDAFLAQNKNQPGVKILPATAMDGKSYDLQYKVIAEGSGETPLPTDTVTVNYRGTFLDGTEFDSSYKHGQPAQFPVNRVIRGWSEALTHMKAGSKWQLFIPSELAYGQAGYGSRIEPDTTLIFEVELLSVQHPQNQGSPPSAPAQPLTSDIIKVQGTNIQVLKPEDVKKIQQSEAQQDK